MNQKEQAKMRRLQAENDQLRKQLMKHSDVYRDHLYELVELRARIQVISEVINEIEGEDHVRMSEL